MSADKVELYNPESPGMLKPAVPYCPTSPSYAPPSPSYNPASPQRDPNSPVYCPRSPTYSPSSPVQQSKYISHEEVKTPASIPDFYANYRAALETAYKNNPPAGNEPNWLLISQQQQQQHQVQQTGQFQPPRRDYPQNHRSMNPHAMRPQRWNEPVQPLANNATNFAVQRDPRPPRVEKTYKTHFQCVSCHNCWGSQSENIDRYMKCNICSRSCLPNESPHCVQFGALKQQKVQDKSLMSSWHTVSDMNVRK